MAERITVSFSAGALPGGTGSLKVTWEDLDRRRDLALLIVAGKDRGFEIPDAAAQVAGGILGVVGLGGGSGSAEVDVKTPIGPAPSGSDLTLLICDGPMPIDRAGIDTSPAAGARDIRLEAPSSQHSERVDGILLVCQSPGAASPAYDLVLAKPGAPLMDRFVHLGVLQYKSAESDPGSGRPLGKILSEYGAINAQHVPEATFEERGHELWEILPSEFRQRYWQAEDLRSLFTRAANGEARTLLIASDDWHFPWEIVAPKAIPGSIASSEELGLLGKRAAISRWRLGDEPPARIAISRAMAWYSDAGGTGGLAGMLERDHVKAYAGTFGTSVPFSPEAGQRTPAQVASLLNANKTGSAHLRAHGSPDMIFTNDVPEGVSPAVLRDLVNRDRSDPPFPQFIFINACAVAGNGGGAATEVQVASDYDPAGGFAEALLSGGCSGVVLTYWAINLTHCIDVAKAFYDELGRNGSLAEAMRSVRQRSLETRLLPKSSTPLAYMVVGHPAAKIVAAPV